MLLLAACGGGQAPATTEETTPAAAPVAAPVQEGGCPAVTVANSQGVPAGAFPQQYELAEFQELAGCELTFQENPNIAALNARISGNLTELPPVAERLPEEPLVVAPYEEIGVYGGVLDGMSNATEAGTSDLLSVRHVNLFRYADDLQTVVPNVAKSFTWNEDFTELTIELRAGHRWSDGEPFTAEDIVFWYNDLILNKNIYSETPSRWLFDGQPMQVEALDDVTVKITFPVPTPGIVNRFAADYGQPFQPKHFLSQFHIDYNADADKLAAEKGFDSWADLLNNYYGASDWKDVPSPLLDGTDTIVVPTLESHILVEETTEGRKLVANPFFHMVDTAGNQLPYINEINERYIPDAEVRNLKLTNGEVDYKSQAVFIENFPLYKENEQKGNYRIDLPQGLGEAGFYSFNVNHKDPEMRRIFEDLRFRQAMSLALNRDEINEVVYLGQGVPQQAVPIEPATVSFITEEMLNYMIEYDPDQANALLDEMGLADVDGDGFRERLDGSPFVVQIQYSNQGAPIRLHELVKEYWEAVGVRIQLKEVTSDEYREQGNNNDLDVTVWKNDGTSAPIISQDITMMVPPFGDYFNPGTGFEWATWKATGGAGGVEPPDDVKKVYELAGEFIRYPLGSEESDRIGREIIELHVKNLWKIGVVGNLVAPVYRHNKVGNIPDFTVQSYDYYWAYPFRPQQWFLRE
ncbi:MAG: ABC transporter substrate-binding protein [Caldilineaceae bacterium]|nr:ABC transporter substrate-binding protein [Caldilineaceae bacterium]